MLQARPEHCGARRAITLAPHLAAELSQPAHRLAQRRRGGVGLGCLVDRTVEPNEVRQSRYTCFAPWRNLT